MDTDRLFFSHHLLARYSPNEHRRATRTLAHSDVRAASAAVFVGSHAAVDARRTVGAIVNDHRHVSISNART